MDLNVFLANSIPSSREQGSVKRAVLDGFGHMLGPDAVCAGEIGDRPGDLQDPVIGPGREPQSRDRHLEQLLPHRRVHQAELPDLARLHPRVGVETAAALKSPCLTVAGFHHAAPDPLRALSALAARQLFVTHCGDLHVQVDPVEQRAGDPGEVPLDPELRAAALPTGVGEMSARTGLRCLFAV